MSDAPMQAAISAIWQRSIPQTRDRLHLLQQAAAELANTRTIDPVLRAEALGIAHKLAGSLGMFGLPEATEHARAIESVLDHPGLPQPERLEAEVQALTAVLQHRLQDS